MSYEEAIAFADARGLAYVETTATDFKTVEAAFILLSREVQNRILDGQIDARGEVGIKVGAMSSAEIDGERASEQEFDGVALGKSDRGGCC